MKSSKTIELIIYVASKLGTKPNYGATLLGKALYFIDCKNYLKTGKPISDLTYIKQTNGPTPEPRKFLSIRNMLVQKGDLEKVDAEYFTRVQHKFIAKRNADVSVFSKKEIILIDDVLATISDQNAAQISELTHLFDCWSIAENKDELPFYSFLLNHQEPTQDDIEWTKSVITKHERSAKNASQ